MGEPSIFLRFAMYHFAGGDAYLLGLMGFAVAQIALCRAHGPRMRRWLKIGGRLGLVWAFADCAPVPWVLIGGFVLLLIAAVVTRFRKPAPESADATAVRREKQFRAAFAGLAVVGIACELPDYWFRAPATIVKTLAVVGDSVTAGLNDGEDTWPKQLAREAKVQVLDASQPGATLKSARQQVALLNSQAADLLILEIGGNDMLEGLPVDVFERDLNLLLAASQKTNRSVVMFELPLPPLAAWYGTVQRRLASRYGVQLIPRRYFVQILTGEGSTVDGIHLSKLGQTRLMTLVQNLLKFAEASSSGEGGYRHFEPPPSAGH